MCSENRKVEDWVDEYFNIQKELGFNITFKIGYKEGDDPGKKIQWSSYSHAQFDGIGGFAHHLRKNGWPIKKLPLSKEMAPPSSISMIIPTILYGLARKRVRPVNWKHFNPDKVKLPSSNIFTGLLDKNKTQKVMLSAKSEGVSVNTYLLSKLDSVVRKALLNEQDKTLWVIPVNLRGAIQRQSDESNHISFFPTVIGQEDTFADIQRLSKKRLSQKTHWITWNYLNTQGEKKGKPAIKKMLEASLNKQVGLVGIFSNLGAWPLADDIESVEKKASLEKKQKCSWYITQNITSKVPVGVAVLNWCGQIGITAQIHASICKNPDIGGGILKQFMESIC